MSESLLNTPILWINKYLQSKLATDVTIGVPLFPANPTTIDQLTEQSIIVPAEAPDQTTSAPTAGLFGVWDRMFRMRRRPFPHIKTEQVLYYFYAVEEGKTSQMVQLQEEVFRLFDREDESAEEINKWSQNRSIAIDASLSVTCAFKFHRFKVYQLEEARDIIDFGTARTYAGNKIIIEYEYHQSDSVFNGGSNAPNS